jgi:guanosine-3',5'-bis(diphosphate) 3'-pyrophosphohydrolase
MSESLLAEAFAMASSAHEGQWRDGDAPLPYISHPVDVVNRLRYIGGITDWEILAAGYLHDTLEETNLVEQRIKLEISPRVYAIVKEVTRFEPSQEQREGLSKDEIWAMRTGYLLSEIAKMSSDGWLIKLADRASNLSNAAVTRTGKKLVRYTVQSEEILKLIPRDTNAPLWDSVRDLVKALKI